MIRERYAPRPGDGAFGVYRRVYLRIRSEILSGRLAPGTRLPSSRTLATELGLARGTVVTAFQMLAGEGYIVSDGARGTIVNLSLPRRARQMSPTRFAAAPGKVRSEHVRTLPHPLLFQVGSPALDAFPRKQWTRIAARVARQLDGEQMAKS
jgi:GntR family transcriptional regulator / MocR family aminotransferase